MKKQNRIQKSQNFLKTIKATRQHLAYLKPILAKSKTKDQLTSNTNYQAENQNIYTTKPNQYIFKGVQSLQKNTQNHFRRSLIKYRSVDKKIKESISQFNSIQNKKSSVLRNKIIKQYGNSPYIKNIKDFDKIQRLMTPAKEPTQSIKLQIKRHNHTSHNIRNHQNVILRGSQNFQQKLATFLNRLGLNKNCKTFIMNSKDFHIKEQLLARGWKQLQDKDSKLFHLKWVYIDNYADYLKLHNSQFYNHFSNNQQLTNKNNLRKNVKMLGKNDRPNLPLTYDLGLKEDQRDFQQAYFTFKCMSLLKKIVNFISKSRFQYYKRVIKNKNYFKHFNYKNVNQLQKLEKKREIFSSKLKNKTNCDLLQKQNSFQKMKKFLIKSQKNQFQQTEDQLQNCSKKYQANSLNNEFTQALFILICLMAKSLSQKNGITYSCFHLSKSQLQKYILKKHEILKQIQQQLEISLKMIYHLDKLSNFFIVQIVKMNYHFQQFYGFNYGYNNVWIIKPVGVSRGAGISINTDYCQISNHKIGKIVQKYIQKPLLLKCKRKFDIRQWVLVRHFYPLQAYIFQNCYARLSPQNYHQNQFSNLLIHLTNFSISKEVYKKTKLNSILLQTDLIQQLGTQSWKKIKQKIKFEILKTLKSCQNQIVQNHQNAFQVYGFDIMLDQQLKPWVIEVNLSPACQKREGLSNYLSKMACGIADMLQNKALSNWELLDQQALNDEIKRQKQKALKNKSSSRICHFFQKILLKKKLTKQRFV